MSSLTDSQLRAELLRYGETVPPITHRNRPDLVARLEILRARPTRPTRASPARASAAGPSRSRPVPGLIEMSDSDTDAPVRPSQRSIQVPQSPSNITSEVEQSRNELLSTDEEQWETDERFPLVARHRREIENLISSARDRTLAANSSISSTSSSVRANEPITTPFRSTATSSSRPRAKGETERRATPAQPSAFQRSRAALRQFWTDNRVLILNILKALLLGILFGGTLILAKNFLPALIPVRQGKSPYPHLYVQSVFFSCCSRHHLYSTECG